jgi:hypothetical protein
LLFNRICNQRGRRTHFSLCVYALVLIRITFMIETASSLTHSSVLLTATRSISSNKETQFTEVRSNDVSAFQHRFLHRCFKSKDLIPCELQPTWDVSWLTTLNRSWPPRLPPEQSPSILILSLSIVHWKDQIKVHKNTNTIRKF